MNDTPTELAQSKIPDAKKSGKGWSAPQPLPCELPVVKPFDCLLLPETMRAWAADIAERMQCPVDYPAVASMWVLGVIVGRQVGIRPKRRDDWLVVPNLWGAVIGRPSLMKTPAIREPLRVSERLEIAAKQEYDEAGRKYAAQEIVANATRKEAEGRLKKAVREGCDAMSIANALVDAEVDPPVRRRYLLNDPTVEKLGEVLGENPNGVGVFRDELVGFLRNLDRKGQEGARAFYLECWDGTGRFTYDRIGRGTLDIESAIVSVFGGIQPGPLEAYLREAVQGGRGDDGLMQRFQLAVWPDCPKDFVNIDRWPDTAAKQNAFSAYERLSEIDLNGIGAGIDSDNPGEIPFLRFCPAAQEQFNAWRLMLERKLRSDSEHPAMEAHLAKYRSLIPSLALLIHLADNGHGPVAVQPLQQAIAWGSYLESHAQRLYAAHTQPEKAASVALARHILAGDVRDGFSTRDIYRNGWTSLTTREEAEAAVACLIDLDWLRAIEPSPGPGRHRTAHRINPRIFKAHELRTDKTDKTSEEQGFVSSVSADPSASGKNLFPVAPTADTDAPNALLAEAAVEDSEDRGET